MEADDLLMVINLVEFIISGKRLLDEIALRLARNLYASYKPTHLLYLHEVLLLQGLLGISVVDGSERVRLLRKNIKASRPSR